MGSHLHTYSSSSCEWALYVSSSYSCTHTHKIYRTIWGAMLLTAVQSETALLCDLCWATSDLCCTHAAPRPSSSLVTHMHTGMDNTLCTQIDKESCRHTPKQAHTRVPRCVWKQLYPASLYNLRCLTPDLWFAHGSPRTHIKRTQHSSVMTMSWELMGACWTHSVFTCFPLYTKASMCTDLYACTPMCLWMSLYCNCESYRGRSHSYSTCELLFFYSIIFSSF